ncbi:hypothetical protein WJX72_000457 [[Myrmecia] bisecta]|uniref:Uncharacterized protein n=1 Tax=[Myrmecia] bisecta TaxID=41462 RepID=A0AAW1PDF4_9CHLO
MQTMVRPHLDVTQLHMPVIHAWNELASLVPATRDEAAVLLERLQLETAALGTSTGLNVVAFTGDVCTALTAYLVSSVFDESTVACIGKTEALTQEELQQAHFVADVIGLDLVEVEPQSSEAASMPPLHGVSNALQMAVPHQDMVLFSGVSLDSDHSIAAADGGVVCPLAGLSDSAIYAVAKMVGLPILPRCHSRHQGAEADRSPAPKSKLPALQTAYAKQLSAV